jgi:MHS family shikimate/dehydroshikimate transporter-like MFS transporter
VMATSLAFQALFAFPFFWLIDTGSTVAVIVAVTIGIAGGAAASDAIQPAYFPSMFGTNIRFSGVSLGREGGTIIGGGLSPLIATALLAWAGGPWAVAAWMAITSIAGFAAVFLARPLSRPEQVDPTSQGVSLTG